MDSQQHVNATIDKTNNSQGLPCTMCGAWTTARSWYSIEFDHSWFDDKPGPPEFAYFCGTACMREAAVELRQA